jgi:hypothetical protein
MSNEQEKKPTQKFGTMKQQWETIGGGKGDTEMQGALTQKRHDVKASEQEEMKRQTVYMPKTLATRLKARAALIGDDISGIITRLVETYLDEAEKEK